MLSNRKVLLAKLESPSGTDAVPTVGADEIEVLSLSVLPKFEKIERRPLRASLSPRPIKKSKKVWELEFEVELKGSGTPGVAGRLAALFKACAHAETTEAGSSMLYKPASACSTLTFYAYEDGLLKKCVGAMITGAVLNIEHGKIATIKFKAKSKYALPTDAALPTPTYEATEGVVAEGCNFAISGYQGVFRSLSIDLAPQTVDRGSINAAGAIEGIGYGGRKPTGKLVMEAVLRATEDVWDEHNDADVISLTGTLGTVAGNKFSISAAGVQYDELNEADDNGIITQELSLVFSGTDDEYTLIQH